MITWKQKLNASGKEVGIIEGFVGELMVATIKETGPAHRPPAEYWQGEFFPFNVLFFRDTIEDMKTTAEYYWKKVLEQAELEATKERMRN